MNNRVNLPAFSVAKVSLPGHFGLAPMAGFTDRSFRQICREQGAGYTVTEMVSAKALCYGDKKTGELLSLSKGEHPCAVQIFGSEPPFLARGAALALEASGADIVDINMGCPMGKIIRSGEGSALMSNPAHAAACVMAVKKAVSVPVTVKFRAGTDDAHKNAVEFARYMEDAGADALCIHGRTATQMYTGRADRGLMARVVAAVSVPVAVNGDITCGRDGISLLRETGAAYAMVGRGSLGNPFLFAELAAAMEGRTYSPPTLEQRLALAVRQVRLTAEHKGEHRACREARAHLIYYFRAIRNAAAFRSRACAVSSLADIEALCREVLETVKEIELPNFS